MAERIPCEFFLIRYVPDVVKGEFTNIGVLLRPVGAARADARPSHPILRFTRDWSRVRCMDADADLTLLESLEAELLERMRASEPGLRPVLEVLEDSLSNSIQITPARACLAESLPAEMEQLLRMYVEPLKARVERRRTGRAAIAASIRTEFERAGVWALLRKRIAAAPYTRPGDPLRLDCGYRSLSGNHAADRAAAAGTVRIFHAVSLEGDVEAAKVMAYSAPQLREGVLRVENAELDLTAIVEPLRSVVGSAAGATGKAAGVAGRAAGAESESEAEDDEAGERYRFGVESMERQQIRVMTVSDLARIAATARIELRV